MTAKGGGGDVCVSEVYKCLYPKPQRMFAEGRWVAFRTSAHYPLSVIADSDALTGFFELEVLQKLDATCIFRIIFETSFAFARKPFGEWTGSG